MHGDEVTKIRITQIRATYLPAVFATKTSVPVLVGNHQTDVRITTTREPACFGGSRRWILCPACSRRTTVICFSAMHALFGCRRCLIYRTRRSAVLAPHARGSAQIDPRPNPTKNTR